MSHVGRCVYLRLSQHSRYGCKNNYRYTSSCDGRLHIQGGNPQELCQELESASPAVCHESAVALLQVYQWGRNMMNSTAAAGSHAVLNGSRQAISLASTSSEEVVAPAGAAGEKPGVSEAAERPRRSLVIIDNR